MRLLRLLSLLQVRRVWAGSELAQRLEVSIRTVRRDVDKLRQLGYPVATNAGLAGYELAAGATAPPLLLDDDEAVAIVVGLRAAVGGVTGIEEASLRALAKIEQLLPAHLRRRINALATFTVPLVGGGPTVDGDTLTRIAAACRDAEKLRIDYRDHHDASAARRTPVHLHRVN